MHYSWADVKETYDWLPQQDIIKVTMEEIKCFETCEKAGSISKIYLLKLKGDEIGNNSSFSGKVLKFRPIETQLFLLYMFLKNDMIRRGV